MRGSRLFFVIFSKIFVNIGGTKEIKSMLEYIANSDEKHMVDDATNEIGEYVKYIKEAPEVRSGFMTYGEYFDILVEEPFWSECFKTAFLLYHRNHLHVTYIG